MALWDTLKYVAPTGQTIPSASLTKSNTPTPVPNQGSFFQQFTKTAGNIWNTVSPLINKATDIMALSPSTILSTAKNVLTSKTQIAPKQLIPYSPQEIQKQKFANISNLALGFTAEGGVNKLKSAISKEVPIVSSGIKKVASEVKTGISSAIKKTISLVESGLPKVETPLNKVPLKTPQTDTIQQLSQKGISYAKDITAVKQSQGITREGINTNNLKISDQGKQIINNAIDEIKPRLVETVGKPLSNQETIDLANKSSKIFSKAVDRSTTLQWEAGLLNLRRKISASAENGTVDKSFINDLLALKTRGADIGRKLQSFSIEASGDAVSSKQAIIDAVLKVNSNIDEIAKAAEGVDFNDYNQASNFYRQFISPKATEILDLVRYNSMLSSPNTHIINTFSNLINTAVVAPIEKTLIGTVDFLGSKIRGYKQTRLAGEGATYLKGYLNNIGEAATRFSDVLKGRKAFTNLDIQNIPLTTTGVKGSINKILSYPSKLLEASDQFFTTLASAGETSALESRVKAGIPVKNINLKAQEDAAYRLYRQDLFDPNQGHILDAVDRITNIVMQARNSPNQIISTIAKFTVPFVKTPMNILKQGIEYSPIGFGTVPGATDKLAQVVKASVGSAIFGGAATMLASGRITGAEPISTAQKADFRASGKQPYSVKIGNKWVSYQKLPPGISFPLAMVSILNDLEKNKTSDQDTSDLVLTGIAKYGTFLSDQSYAKSIGDLLAAVKGGENSISQLISNYPQQVIPFRALGGWITRLIDTTQRKVDSKGTFIEKQMQTLMLNIPGLSQKVPARLDNQGNPILNTNSTLNAFSPVKVTNSNAQLEKFLNDKTILDMAVKEQQIADDKVKETVQPIYDQVMKLKQEGKLEDAQKLVDNLTDNQYEIYKSIRTADKTRNTKEGQIKIIPIVQQVQQLKNSGKITEAQAIVDGLTDDEYRYYQLAKNKLNY